MNVSVYLLFLLCSKGKKRDTGVRYSDVAGIESVKSEIREILDILLGDRRYLDMGAHPVRVSNDDSQPFQLAQLPPSAVCVPY
jgi:hypothetical protein